MQSTRSGTAQEQRILRKNGIEYILSLMYIVSLYYSLYIFHRRNNKEIVAQLGEKQTNKGKDVSTSGHNEPKLK